MGVEESLQAGTSSAHDLSERWPAGEKVAEQDGVTLVKPVQCVRIVLLEGNGQAIGESRLVVDQLTTMLGEAAQGAHLHALWLQRGKSLRVPNEKIQGKFGIGWIVLGAAGREGLTVFGQRQRGDGQEHKEVVFLQCVNDRAFGQFQCNGYRTTKAPVHRVRPL